MREVETPRQPLRVVVDSHAETPPARACCGRQMRIVVTPRPTQRAVAAGVETLALPNGDGRVDLARMLRRAGSDAA